VIEVLGYPKVAGLAISGGLADASRSIEARPMASFFARNGTLAKELQDYFAGFAVIVSFLYDPDGIFQENVGICSKAQFIAGPHRPDEGEGLHVTETFLRPLQRLAIYDADTQPRLSLQQPNVGIKDMEWVRSGRTLAIHPGSGSEQKNWAEDRWGNLIRSLLSETTLQLLLVGGEAEGSRLTRLQRQIPPERGRVADSLELLQLAQLLGGCAAFLGHDSGIMHLAAALGLPGLALWGSTNEKIWGPRSHRMKVLKPATGLHSLSVNEVLSEVKAIHDLGLGQKKSAC
jgi:heptosyltransferase III